MPGPPLYGNDILWEGRGRDMSRPYRTRLNIIQFRVIDLFQKQPLCGQRRPGPASVPAFQQGGDALRRPLAKTRVHERARQNAHHIIEVAVSGHGNCTTVQSVIVRTVSPWAAALDPDAQRAEKSCVPMNCAAAACMAARLSAAPTLWQVS